MAEFKIMRVDSSNFEKLGLFCVKNKKHPGYTTKAEWLKTRFEEGLRIKLIVDPGGKPTGFLEYVPAEYSWRVVEAPGYFIIHCIWTKSKKFETEGLAAVLLEDCFKDAEKTGKKGVAVVSSDGPWMASGDIFVKTGFEQVDKAEPHYQLLVKRTGNYKTPAFPQNWKERLSRFSGLKLLYAGQCPYIGKAVRELPPMAEKHGVHLELVELKTPAEARQIMPSPSGTFCLIYEGRLLADHPISATRFKNILQKDLKLKMQK